MPGIKHLIWIPIGLVVGFLSSFIFGDQLRLPVDLYYFIYFSIIVSFFIFYYKKTNLRLKTILSKRLVAGIALGLLFSFLMIKNVVSRPSTEKFSGAFLLWAIVWRGLFYGAIDGLLLTVFPWIVTWRAFKANDKPLFAKIGVGFIAWIFIVLMTTAYHLGYGDFRSEKVFQANIGNTIMSIPTLLSANPIATPITHASMHIAAVIHSPKTDLFLPPHR